MGFTLEMEQSLQAINANVSIPYWDYTTDALMYATDWTKSPIFDDDWFGMASPESDDHMITHGRWAYLEIEKLQTDVDGFSQIHNPYNLLRAPWNTNPTPYVTRYRFVDGLMDGGWALPNCIQFQQARSRRRSRRRARRSRVSRPPDPSRAAPRRVAFRRSCIKITIFLVCLIHSPRRLVRCFAGVEL